MPEELKIGGKACTVTGGFARLLRLKDEFIHDFGPPEAAVDQVRASRLGVDLITFIQRPPDLEPKFDYYLEWDNLAVLPVTTYDSWFTGQVHQNTRNKIRKAQKSGVVVRVEPFTDELALALVELFNETPTRRGRAYSYFGWTLEQVKRGWATDLDRSIFLVAYFENELIGFIKLVRGGHIMRTSGTVAKLAYRDRAPMNALMAKAVEVCSCEQVPFLVYGHFNYGRGTEDSLAAFKRYNGFQKTEIPRYYIPISWRGRLTLRGGLHHGFSNLLPKWLYRAAFSLRSKWNSLLSNLAEI